MTLGNKKDQYHIPRAQEVEQLLEDTLDDLKSDVIREYHGHPYSPEAVRSLDIAPILQIGAKLQEVRHQEQGAA